MSPQEFVSSRFGTRAGALAPLGAGWWSRAYALTLDGREAVIRFGRYVEDFRKDELMGRLGGRGLPVPRVIETGEAPDGYFCVAERAYGVPLDELDGAGMREVLPDLLAVMRATAAIEAPGPGYGAWDGSGVAPHRTWRDALLAVAEENPRTAGWRRSLAGSPEAERAFATGYAALRDAAANLPEARQIVHCDLLYHNVLVQGPRVTAVLDWGCAMYGDALYDAAWLVYWWPWYPAWSGIDIRRAFPADAEPRLRAYQLHIGLAHIAWNAFTRNTDELTRNARQTMALARG